MARFENVSDTAGSMTHVEGPRYIPKKIEKIPKNTQDIPRS